MLKQWVMVKNVWHDNILLVITREQKCEEEDGAGVSLCYLEAGLQ